MKLRLRSRQHDHGFIVREATPQDGLQDVVDYAAVVVYGGSNVDANDRFFWPHIRRLMVLKVIDE
jgi:hypothetical protein